MGKPKSNEEEPIFVVDTREQKPYDFKKYVKKGLKTGDYSILGFEDSVAIERKSKEDAYQSLGKGRKRFEKELQRLSEMDYAAIVIESSLKDFLTPPCRSKMHPKAAINSILAWSVKYKVFLFFAEDRLHAKALTRQLLLKYWRYHNESQNDR